jgi:hypothetical protein
LTSQALSSALEIESHFLAPILGDAWRGAATDFALLHKVARTTKALAAFDADLDFGRVIDLAREGVAASFADGFESRLASVGHALAGAVQALDLDIAAVFGATAIATIDLERLADRAGRWAAHPCRFEECARLSEADAQLRAIGPVSIADALASGQMRPKRAHAIIEAAFAEASWKQAIAVDPDLAAFDGERHNALVAAFRELEARRRRAATLSVRAQHQAAIPRGALGAMGVIRGEIGRKRNHMPLRKLMKTAGDGIVTFSTAQRDLISDRLEAKRRSDPLLDALSPRTRAGGRFRQKSGECARRRARRDPDLHRLWPARARKAAGEHGVRSDFERGRRAAPQCALYARSRALRDLRVIRFGRHQSRARDRRRPAPAEALFSVRGDWRSR